MNTGDTIAAFSSTVAPAGRIVVRMSGPAAITIVKLFCESLEAVSSSAKCVVLKFADLTCSGWVYTFVSPNSYTGEDLAEVHLPGSPPLAQLFLDEILKSGARLAEPGEFTARAYFNGKLDLSEAEGVAAIIAAGNDAELSASRQLLAGELARRLRPSIDLIAETLALVEVGIDFSEEDVSFLPTDEIVRRVTEVTDDLTDLLDQSNRFEKLSHEPRIVLVGRPNAGKSTLINALTGGERAVVSNIAGTTRDVLSASANLEHGRITIIDVAGFEAADYGSDLIETQMRERAVQALESADHVLLIRDSTDESAALQVSRNVDLIVRTKIDLLPSAIQNKNEILISASTGAGMAELKDALDRLAFGGEGTTVGLALNRRHIADIEDARSALTRAIDRVSDNAAELIALELRESLDALGRVLGSVTPDDVLGRVFSAFCIGK